MKLKIKNFQSISETELILNPGITIIAGANHSGKSAIFRALKAFLTNPRGCDKKYVKHYTDQAEVEVELDGNDYKWIKGEKLTQYETTIDGDYQEYKKCGNNNIFDYDKNFPFIVRDKKILNIHTEWDLPFFPLCLSDIEIFKIFEDLYQVSSSSVIFKFMKSFETNTNREINYKTEQVESNKTKIDKIIDLQSRYDLDKLISLRDRSQEIYSSSNKVIEDYNIAKINAKCIKNINTILDNTKEFDLTTINDLKDIKSDYILANNNDKILNTNIYECKFDLSIIDSYKDLYSDYNKSNLLNKEIDSIDSEISDLELELKEVKDQLSKIDICPLCKQPIKENK